MTSGCGADAADRAETGQEPVGDPVPSPAPDSAVAEVDLTGLPGYRESQARVARVALTLVSLPHQGVLTIARASMDDREAWELAVHLTSRGLDFPRVHRDPSFTIPLIERLGRGGAPPAFEDHWFELVQMALVGITPVTTAGPAIPGQARTGGGRRRSTGSSGGPHTSPRS